MENEELKLLADKKYEGKFVALRSPCDTNIIAYGDDPCEVSRLAAEKGIKEPVIFFVPEADVEYVYQLSKFKL
jgi:hypothetical protein